MSDIIKIELGLVNAFLLKGNKYILVDTGRKTSYRKILSTLEKRGIAPEEIELIILTHSHDDHIGSLDVLLNKTGAKCLMQKKEYDCLMNKEPDEIKPYTWLMKLAFKFTSSNQESKFKTKIDILMNDEFDLTPYGVQGKIIHTPGHSKGSISILLDDGKAFIGDNLMANFPWSKPQKPMIAYDLSMVKKSINKLISLGAKRFYLSHGKDYDVGTIKQIITNF